MRQTATQLKTQGSQYHIVIGSPNFTRNFIQLHRVRRPAASSAAGGKARRRGHATTAVLVTPAPATVARRVHLSLLPWVIHDERIRRIALAYRFLGENGSIDVQVVLPKVLGTIRLRNQTILQFTPLWFAGLPAKLRLELREPPPTDPSATT